VISAATTFAMQPSTTPASSSTPTPPLMTFVEFVVETTQLAFLSSMQFLQPLPSLPQSVLELVFPEPLPSLLELSQEERVTINTKNWPKNSTERSRTAVLTKELKTVERTLSDTTTTTLESWMFKNPSHFFLLSSKKKDQEERKF